MYKMCLLYVANIRLIKKQINSFYEIQPSKYANICQTSLHYRDNLVDPRNHFSNLI